MEGEMIDFAKAQLHTALETIKAVQGDASLLRILTAAARHTAEAMTSSKKLLIAGNGGSAADAQHLVAEFVSRMTVDRPAMRAVALTTDTSILTAVGNDYGFEVIFERQIDAIGLPGDVFIGLSTSGKSPNILRGLKRCRTLGITTIGFTGQNGSTMEPLCDYCLKAPSCVTHHIQEAHLILEHIYCQMTERFYFGVERFENPKSIAATTV
jgi:D-sedoheptulose 7-phosphate isomerase